MEKKQTFHCFQSTSHSHEERMPGIHLMRNEIIKALNEAFYLLYSLIFKFRKSVFYNLIPRSFFILNTLPFLVLFQLLCCRQGKNRRNGLNRKKMKSFHSLFFYTEDKDKNVSFYSKYTLHYIIVYVGICDACIMRIRIQSARKESEKDKLDSMREPRLLGMKRRSMRIRSLHSSRALTSHQQCKYYIFSFVLFNPNLRHTQILIGILK